MAKTKTKRSEELDEDVELDELDEDVEEEDAPKKGRSDEVEFGASDLAAHLTKVTGKKITARDLRTLLRKMARDGSGRIDREITAGNRTRYNWEGGLKNPEVKTIIKAVKAGELEQGKKEALDALKARKAEKKAKEGGKKGKKAKAAEPDDDEDVDDDDLDLDDDDE